MQARINSLETEISRVSEKDHPYPEPDIIYEALKAVLSDRKSVFDDAIHQYLVDGDERSLQVIFNTIAIDLERVSELFGLADRVDSARIPFEILRALSWVAKQLLDEQCRAVVRLDGMYNYSFISCRRRFEHLAWDDFWHEALEKKSTELDGRQGLPVSDVMILGFPSPDASSILLHALAAHELGHHVCTSFFNEMETIRDGALIHVKRNHANLIQEYIAENAKKHLSDHDAYEESSKHAEAKLFTIAERWLSEVFADIVAARLVGPAFLGAFDRIVLELDKPSDTHPPGSLRRESVGTYLKKWLPHIIDDEPAWIPLLARSASHRTFSSTRPEAASLYKVGEEVIHHSLDAISQLVAALPSPLQQPGFKDLLKDIEAHLMHLAPPVTPLCDRKAINADSFWILMFAAWHFRLAPNTFDEFKDRHGWSKNVTKAENALGNLLLHSLQSLELRYQWQERLKNQKGTHDGSQ